MEERYTKLTPSHIRNNAIPTKGLKDILPQKENAEFLLYDKKGNEARVSVKAYGISGKGMKKMHVANGAKPGTIVTLSKSEPNKYLVQYESADNCFLDNIQSIESQSSIESSQVSVDNEEKNNSDKPAKRWFTNYILGKLNGEGKIWKKLSKLPTDESDNVNADVKICKVDNIDERRYYEIKSQNEVLEKSGKNKGKRKLTYFGGVSLSEIESAIRNPDTYRFVFIRRKEDNRNEFYEPIELTLLELLEFFGPTIQVNFKFNMNISFDGKDRIIIDPRNPYYSEVNNDLILQYKELCQIVEKWQKGCKQ